MSNHSMHTEILLIYKTVAFVNLCNIFVKEKNTNYLLLWVSFELWLQGYTNNGNNNIINNHHHHNNV